MNTRTTPPLVFNGRLLFAMTAMVLRLGSMGQCSIGSFGVLASCASQTPQADLVLSGGQPPYQLVFSASNGSVMSAEVAQAGAIATEFRRQLIVFGIAATTTLAALAYVLLSGWLLNPQLGLLGVGLIGFGAAVAITLIFAGLNNKRALYSALTTAAAVSSADAWPYLFPGPSRVSVRQGS